jgi:hypothetical protein
MAKGEASEADQKRLRLEFERTDRQITEATKELDEIKDKLCAQAGNAAFALEIDKLVYNGKAEIRERISRLLDADLSDPNTQAEARGICNSIEAFNRSVIQLGKRATQRS